jgi:hypothetical protein
MLTNAHVVFGPCQLLDVDGLRPTNCTRRHLRRPHVFVLLAFALLEYLQSTAKRINYVNVQSLNPIYLCLRSAR